MQANTTMLAQFRLALQAEDGDRLAQLLNLSDGHTKALARALEKGHVSITLRFVKSYSINLV